MKGVKEIKQRMKGVANIRKITKAMEMVSTTKLRRFQGRSLATRPFATRIEQMIRRVAAHVDPSFSPLLQERSAVAAEGVLVVASDRGLCGAYNVHVYRHLQAHVNSLLEQNIEPRLLLFGRRLRPFVAKLPSVTVDEIHPDPVERMDYQAARKVVRTISAGFLSGKYDRVRVIYSAMKSMVSFVPVTADLLPIPKQETGQGELETEYILEPSPHVIMERLLPRFLEMQVLADILEALTSEFAARRIAMKNATDSADEMIGNLRMQYNKARQAGITEELLDIIGGAEAQKA